MDATTRAVRTMEWDVEAALEQEELEARTGRDDVLLGRYRLEHKLG